MTSVRTLAAVAGCLAVATPAQATFWWYRPSGSQTSCPPDQDLWCGFCYPIPACTPGLVWKSWRYGCQRPDFVAPTWGVWGWPQRQQTQGAPSGASVIPTGVASFDDENEVVQPMPAVVTTTCTRRPRVTRTRRISVVPTDGEQWQTLSVMAPTGVVFFPSGNFAANTPASVVQPRPTTQPFTATGGNAEITLSVVALQPQPALTAQQPLLMPAIAPPAPVPTTAASATKTGGGGFILSVIPNSVLEESEPVTKTAATPTDTPAPTIAAVPAPAPAADVTAFQGQSAASFGDETTGDNMAPANVNEPEGCPVGFGGSDCADVNECMLGQHNCSPDASCRNAIGSFTCKCGNGYAGDGITCVNILGVDAR